MTPIATSLRPAAPGARPSVRVLIRIADTGMGIPLSKQHLLFKPFSQITGKGNTGGTGLGLVICELIVKTMGGSIVMQSDEGEGTTFFIEVPLVIGAEPQPRGDAPAASCDCGAGAEECWAAAGEGSAAVGCPPPRVSSTAPIVQVAARSAAADQRLAASPAEAAAAALRESSCNEDSFRHALGDCAPATPVGAAQNQKPPPLPRGAPKRAIPPHRSISLLRSRAQAELSKAFAAFSAGGWCAGGAGAGGGGGSTGSSGSGANNGGLVEEGPAEGVLAGARIVLALDRASLTVRCSRRGALSACSYHAC